MSFAFSILRHTFKNHTELAFGSHANSARIHFVFDILSLPVVRLSRDSLVGQISD